MSLSVRTLLESICDYNPNFAFMSPEKLTLSMTFSAFSNHHPSPIINQVKFLVCIIIGSGEIIITIVFLRACVPPNPGFYSTATPSGQPVPNYIIVEVLQLLSVH